MALLLESGGCAVDATGALGATPLHVAVQAGALEAARALLGGGAAVNATTATGHTPLHVAAHQGAAQLVKLLLEYAKVQGGGAQGGGGGGVAAVRALAAAADGAGDTALSAAVAHGRTEVVRVLLQEHADIYDATLLDAPLGGDNQGVPVLHLAVRHLQLEAASNPNPDH